ncbi:MAG: ABC transporter substrate binding protein [Pseudomonadota bacterium]
MNALKRWAVLAFTALGSHGALAQNAPDSVVRIHRMDPVLLAQATEQQKRQHATGAEPIGVLFPDIGEPFRRQFTEIIDGIEDQTRLRVRGYPISPNQDIGELSTSLKRSGTRVVIALGRQGFKAAGSLDAPMGIVVSGMSSVPDGDRQIGICLTPDPSLLFSQLKALLPAARRVIVVYNPQNNDWLIKIAREAARAQGLELLAYEARDLASAARAYEAAFATADSHHDALWLPTDPTTVDESTILPLVLRESWNRNVPFFSSSLLHVRRGALFALYPNNLELGRNLANMALGMLAGENQRKGVVPLREVRTALNTRTASHFGLNIGTRAQRAFDYLYPEP